VTTFELARICSAPLCPAQKETAVHGEHVDAFRVRAEALSFRAVGARLLPGNDRMATEEIPMTTISRNVQQRAAAKEERARDAALAMQEYEAEKRAVDVKTARLRALRERTWERGPPPY